MPRYGRRVQRSWAPLALVISFAACGGQATEVDGRRTPEGGASSIGGSSSATDASATGGSRGQFDAGPVTPDARGTGAANLSCITLPALALGPAMFVAYDASVNATGQEWRVDVIRAIGDDPRSANLKIGMQYFPIGDVPQACTASYDVPYAPMGPVSDVLRGVDGFTTTGPRTLGPALAGAIQQLKAWTALHPVYATEVPVVVLLTTGAPEECTPSTMQDLAAVAADGTTSDPVVRTAVLGPQDLSAEFDAVAKAGLTDRAYRLPSTAAAARGASDFIYGLFDRGPCAFDETHLLARWNLHQDPQSPLPPPEAGLVVEQTSADGTTQRLPQVDSWKECGTSDGWYLFLDNALQPSDGVALCPKNCAETKTNPMTLHGCSP